MTIARLHPVRRLTVTLSDVQPRHLVNAADGELTAALGACLQLQRTLMAELRARTHSGELALSTPTGADPCTRKSPTLLG